MVLKLHGNATSTCTLRVAIVLHEVRAPFEFVQVNFAQGEHLTPEYRKIQPFGQIPYIEDDGFTLYESRAITRYIYAKYKNDKTPQLVPSDLKGNALFEQAASIESEDFKTYAEPAVAEMIFKVYRGQTPDKKVFDNLIANLSAKLDVYDVILSKQKYLAGNEITLADLFHLPYGVMLSKAGSDIMTAKPNVARWFNDLTQRKSWKSVQNGVKSVSSYDNEEKN